MNIYDCDLVLKLRIIGNSDYNFVVESDEGDGIEMLEKLQNKKTPAEYKHYIEWIRQLEYIKQNLLSLAEELLGDE